MQLLERARGKSKREIERIVAEIAPQPDVPSQMRKLPQASALRFRPQQRGTDAAEPVPTGREPRPTHDFAATSPQSGAQSASQPAHAPSARREAPGEVAADGALEVTAGVVAQTAISCGRVAAHSLPARSEQPTFGLQSLRARAACVPLSAGRYKLQLSVGQEVHDRLEQLKELLRHRVPDGDLARIVELALDVLLQKTLKQRFAQRAVGRKSPGPRAASARGSEMMATETGDGTVTAAETGAAAMTTAETGSATAITAAIAQVEAGAAERVEWASVVQQRVTAGASQRQREGGRGMFLAVSCASVFARDSGQCTFVSSQEQRCAARGFLEVHLATPFALGGAATVENLRLMCRAHNALLGFMVRKLRQVRADHTGRSVHIPNAPVPEKSGARSSARATPIPAATALPGAHDRQLARHDPVSCAGVRGPLQIRLRCHLTVTC